MPLTRLSIPVVILLLAMLAWPYGVAVLAAVIIMDIGTKREWHSVDIFAACVVSLGVILWLCSKLGA